MNKNRQTANLPNVITFDENGNMKLPESMSLTAAPHSSDNSLKVPSTAWVRTHIIGLSYATTTYVDNAISGLVDAAPGALDTLNELAAALGDDANFATTVTNSLAGKEPSITAGTTTQYWRGDKSWQTLPVYTLAGLGGQPALSGTGFVKISGTTISYDNSTYLTSITSANVTTALGFTPYNATNPSSYIALGSAITGYAAGTNTALAATDTVLAAFGKIQGQINARLTGITSGQVTTALGYTPLSSAGNVTIGGYLTVTGAGTSSSIYMSDSDEGQREIHCNSNRIGFLTQAGSWGAYCDDSGNWFANNLSGTNTGDQTNISGNAGTVGGYSVAVGGSANTIPTRNGSGYLIPENWIQLNGIYGLYSPTNNAHFYPNNSSYGSWKSIGERNGWRGIHFGEGTGMTLMMNETEFGFHREAHGWYARFTNGHFHGYANSAGSISGQANSATINATSGNAGNNIVLRDGNGDIAIGTLNASHAMFGGGGRGLTAADTYGSYGNVMTYGTGQNGYSGYGIYTNAGYRTFFMGEGGNFGIYGQTIGKWAFYYSNGTASYAIGSSDPVSGYTLYLIYGLYTVGLYNASDARLKKDIKPLLSSLDKVKLLRGVSYEYIDKGEDGTKNNGIELGFIAQEVLPIVPELIRYDEKKGYAMNYNGVTALLVEAIKEQQVQIDELKALVKALTK